MMDQKVVFMFSGQGSHYYQMGRSLYETDGNFKYWMQRLDNLCVQFGGYSVIEKLYDNDRKKSELLTDLKVSHPGIVMVEYALAKSLIQANIQPDFIVGSSLGEYTAAAVAGGISEQDLIKLVLFQANHYQLNCCSGKMLALLATRRQVQVLQEKYPDCEVVSKNYDQHFVVAGETDRIEGLLEEAKHLKLSHQLLPVDYAFHTRLLDGLYQSCIEFNRSLRYSSAQIPVISSYSTDRVATIDAGHIWSAIRNPMDFDRTIQNLEAKNHYCYLDLGPSETLANFTKKNLTANSQSSVHFVMAPYADDGERLKKLVELAKPNLKKRQHKDMKKMKAFLFPGQGSQHKGMGKNVFQEFPDLVQKADTILGYSIEQLCTLDPQQQLNQTQFTQPALYTVNALSYLQQKGSSDFSSGHFLAGHSLGEYSALFAAGVFDFETGLHLVKKRGELMSRVANGGMAAIINCSRDNLQKILEQNQLDEIDVANFNTPKQIVISGPKQQLDIASQVFNQAPIRYVPLNVSAAFHSRYMQPVVKEFEEYIQPFQFNHPEIPVIANVTARPYQYPQLKTLLANQMSHSVQWIDTIRYLMGQGVSEYVEVGPGNVLQTFSKTIQHLCTPLSVNEQIPAAKKAKTQTSLNEDQERSKIASDSDKNEIGSRRFKQCYGIRHAYLVGGMTDGISSKEMVVKLGTAGLLGFYSSVGLDIKTVAENIDYIQGQLTAEQSYGVSLSGTPRFAEREQQLLKLLLEKQITVIEANDYYRLSPALVEYRLKHLAESADGHILPKNKIVARISCIEQAHLFLNPAPESMVKEMVSAGSLTPQQGEWAKRIAMADDVAIDMNSGLPFVIFQRYLLLRDEIAQQNQYFESPRLGIAGGIGTPETAAGAFVMGADFILTHSINQCTVEAKLSEQAKDMLQDMDVQDTTLVPSTDHFEMGEMTPVLNKGVLFPSRAKRMFEIWKQYDSFDDVSPKELAYIEHHYFKNNLDEIYQELRKEFSKRFPEELSKAEDNPKYKMLLILRWYFEQSKRYALKGEDSELVNYQIQCGPELGALNQWLKNSDMASWRNRHVDQLADKVMQGASAVIKKMSLTV